jgi:DNA-binding NarL/FixJ family response regulator
LAAAAQSDYAGAVAFTEEALTRARQHGDDAAVARATFVLALAAVHEGYLDIARAHLADALERFRALNDRGWEGWTLCYQTTVSDLNFLAGQADPAELERAERNLEEALTLFREIGHMPGVARAVHGLAYHAGRQGDYARAVPLAHETIKLRLEQGELWALAGSFEDLSEVALATGHAEQASRLFGASEIQRELHSTPVQTAWRVKHERKIDAVRQALSPEVFAAAWAAGRSLTLEEAVAEALAVQVDPADVAIGPASSPPHDPNDRLAGEISPREREILARIADGQTNQEIATDLSLSIRTVNNHVTTILEKLGQPSRAAAVAVALRLGLI